MKLSELASVHIGMEDADFWLTRRSDDTNVGKPVRTFNKENIGIKIKEKGILNPDYLYYLFIHLHNVGYFKKISNGTLSLVNIKVSDIQNIAFKCN